jgi:hypothetical protein
MTTQLLRTARAEQGETMSTKPESTGAAAPIVPPDAAWIPRLIHELEDQYAEAGADDGPVGAAARSFAALARMAADPWGIAAAQVSMLNLVFAHFSALQVDWADAWWRYFSGALPGPSARGENGTASEDARLPFWPPMFALRPIQFS